MEGAHLVSVKGRGVHVYPNKVVITGLTTQQGKSLSQQWSSHP